MGYSHYFQLNSTPTDEQVKNFNEVVKKIIKVSEISIVNGMGEINTKPVIDKDMIILNGEGEFSYETFMIEFNNLEWSFCKTAFYPYDAVVVAILMTAEKMLDLRWSSDGSMTGGDFNDALILLEKVKI